MTGTMVAEPVVAVSNLTQQIEAGSNNRAATRCAATVGDRHQNGAHSAVHGDLAASYAGCLAKSLAVFGLDVCQPLNLSWYNDAVPEDTGARIPVQGAAGPNTAALLIGNTKQIWEHLLTACSFHQELMDMENPLDTYVERSVEAVLQDVLPGLKCRCFFGHQQLPGGSFVALQRCAQAVGLAHLDAASHLCLHPKYGPWFSLRALLVFDGVPFHGAKPAELPNPLDSSTQRYIRLAVASAMRGSSSDLSDALNGDSRESSGSPPSPNGNKSPEQQRNQRVPAAGEIRTQWKKWVAIRDAPCAGHPWRYSKHQLAYHYTADRLILRRLVAFSSSPWDAPERLAVELELPLAAARRRSRERSRSSSGELPAGLGDGMSAWGSYLAQTSTGGHSNGQPGSRAAAASAANATGQACGGDDGGMEVGSFSPSRRRPQPGLRGVLEDEEAPADADEDAPRRPRLARDSMGSDAGDAADSQAS